METLNYCIVTSLMLLLSACGPEQPVFFPGRQPPPGPSNQNQNNQNQNNQNNPFNNPRMFFPEEPSIFSVYKSSDLKTTFDDVAGLDEAKAALQTIIDYLQDPSSFTRLGAEPPSGVIFYGPPGTGKTELARAFAGEVSKARKNISFIVASGASFENKYVGVGADNVRKLFSLARKNKPAIIFIDEFDAVAGKRSEEKKNAQVVNQLLTELDGFDKGERANIFLIAATNLLSDIDAAVIRPGRIDRKVEVGLPNDVARKAILEHYMKKEPAIKGIQVASLVAATAGWSTAELKALVNEARIHATVSKAAEVRQEDFTHALDFVRKGRGSLRP